MFSKMLNDLRSEAERISASNAEMLAYSRTKDTLAYEISGESAKAKVQIAGMRLGTGGVIGIVGLAMANQAAAYGSVGLLANVSTALASLGTVAVGSAVLPAATVATLGATVAGVAVLGISTLMKVDWDKGADISNAAMANDRESLKHLGRQNIGLGDWLKSAKNLVFQSMRESIMSRDNSLTHSASPVGVDNSGIGSLIEKPQGRSINAFVNYELEDLFGTAEESVRGKQQHVEKIGSDIWEKHGVVVSDDKLHDVLGKTRANGFFTGQILDVDHKTGLVLQSLGRGQATVHNLSDFEKAPVVGQNADIVYKGGKMQGAPEIGQALGTQRSVER